MNTIGSHPGAILFRLSMMIILIAILMPVFFSYLEDTEKELEHASVLQTKRIIDSSLAVAFASYAVKGRLNDLNQLAGGNPFNVLKTYNLLPLSYQGELDHDPASGLDPGWYYLKHRKTVIYKSRFIGTDRYFKVLLSYRDENQSGRFESAVDKFTSLQFVRIDGL